MDSFPAPALPFVPLAALFDAHCKNAAAFTSVHRVLVDGLTTLAKQQGALFTTTVDDCSRATGEVLASASLGESTTKQAEAARQVCVSTFDRLRALSDITVKANVAALDILSARVVEAFDDLTVLLAPPATNAVAAASSAIDESGAVVEETASTEEAGTEYEVAEDTAAGDGAVETEAEPVRKPRPRPAKQGRRPTARR
jgi:phasin family protein